MLICIKCYDRGITSHCYDFHCYKCGNDMYFAQEKKIMTNGNALQKVDAPRNWGTREEIVALGDRLKVMLPGGQALTSQQAMALAQYSKLADANPFRGEIYAAVIKGHVRFIDGYKLLVRWAKRAMPYNDKYEAWDEERKTRESLKVEDIAYTCFILLEKDKLTVIELVKSGVALAEAYELFAFSASGVVSKKDDMTKQDGNDIAPPKGWTWHDVAKKRALKNALNLSHGAPSPSEISKETWVVDDVETEQVDWDQAQSSNITDPDVIARLARLEALNRGWAEERATMEPEELKAQVEEDRELLRGKKENGIGEDWSESQQPTKEELAFTEAFVGTVVTAQEQSVDPFEGGVAGYPTISIVAGGIGDIVSVATEGELTDEPVIATTDTPITDIPWSTTTPISIAEIKPRNLGEVKTEIFKLGYGSSKAQDNLAKKLFGDDAKLDSLSQLQYHNMIEYGKRSKLLDNADILIEKRLGLVPEIVLRVDPLKTITEAKEFVLSVTKLLTDNGNVMQELEQAQKEMSLV